MSIQQRAVLHCVFYALFIEQSLKENKMIRFKYCYPNGFIGKRAGFRFVFIFLGCKLNCKKKYFRKSITLGSWIIKSFLLGNLNNKHFFCYLIFKKSTINAVLKTGFIIVSSERCFTTGLKRVFCQKVALQISFELLF